MGRPENITVEHEGQVYFLSLVYDYGYLFKSIRNNWINKMTQQLSFTLDVKKYLACWSDVISLYEEDRKTPIRLATLANASVHMNPLKRQSLS